VEWSWAGRGFSKQGYDMQDDKPPYSEYGLACQFLKDVGVAEPTPDAIAQLVEAFLPSLRIMCARGYDPNGLTWRASGWRGQIQEIRKKVDRLWLRGWLRGKFDPDSARDIINYAGFYLRLAGKGEPWGQWGEPGSES
jgi:hypothetical protein